MTSEALGSPRWNPVAYRFVEEDCASTSDKVGVVSRTVPSDEATSTSGFRRYVPLLDWLPRYDRGFLTRDVLAGLTVWALVVPESMAYASIAGVPVQYGLYAVPLALVGYVVFGSCRQLFVGPSATVASISAVAVAAASTSATNQSQFIALTAALALMVGVIYILLGLARMGFVARFFAKPVLDGFIIGLGLYIAVGQFPKLVGIPKPSGDTVQIFVDTVRDIGDWQGLTVVIGVISLAALFGLARFLPKAPGALIVVVLAILAVGAFDLEGEGVSVVGTVPTGFDFVSWSGITWGQIWDLVPGALAVVIVGFAQSVAIAKAYGAKGGYRIDASQEMIGYGAANLGAGALQGFTVTGSLSKSAAAEEAGGKSPILLVVTSAFVVLTILFLAGLFKNLPEATLAAVVIHAVSGMIDFSKLAHLWRVHRDEFVLALGALLGVIVIGILAGVLIGVLLSLGLLIRRLVRPLITLHSKLSHGSGGEQEAFARARESLLAALGLVAVADVCRHREAEAVPVEVVGVLDDELADGAEVALNSVQVAGVGGGRHELDVVLGCPRPDRGRPVAGEVVLDPVEPPRAWVGEPDLAHELKRGGAVAAGPEPPSQVVGVDVERAHQVADSVAAAVGRPLALGPCLARPASPRLWAQADRAHLVEADHDPVCRLLSVERQHARRSRLVVGIGTRFPGARALEREPGAGEQPCEVGGRDSGPLPAQILRKLGQAPAREWHPERVGTGAGDRDDPLLVVNRDPAGSPAPETRAQRLEAALVEVVGHLAHVRLVCEQHARDLRWAHQRRRGQQDHRPLPRRGVLGPLRQPLQPLPLTRSERTNENRRGTHRHLLRSHTSRFNGRSQFPVERYEKAH